MKSIFRLFIITALLSVSAYVYAQTSDLTIQWSDIQNYSNKTGYLQGIAGTNSKYVYVLQDIRIGAIHSPQKYRLTAFDKTTLQRVASVPIKGFKENQENKSLMRRMYIWRFVITDDNVYVFWLKEDKESDVLYVQGFTPDLKKRIGLKKVYELKSKKGAKRQAELFVRTNSKNQILLGGELSADKGENIRLQYRLLDNDMSFLESGQVTLPIVATKGKANSLSSYYEFGDNKILYAVSLVVVGDKKHQEEKYLMSAIDVTKNTIKTIEISDPMRNISHFSFYIGKKYLRFTGFYSDKTDDKIKGVFSANVDKKNLSFIGTPSFAKFTPQYLHILSDVKAKNKKKEKRKRKQELDLVPYYSLIKTMEYRGNLIQIYSVYHEYYVTNCNKNGCVTNYYQNNYNVLAISISKSGEINWMDKIERTAFYNGWGHEDVSVIQKGKKYYIFYTDNFIFNPEKNKRVYKNKEMRRTMLNYAILNPDEGKMEPKTYIYNALKEPAKTRRYVYADNIETFGNEIYVTYVRVRKKPTAIALTVLLVPTLFGPFLPGKFSASYYGYGYIGRIDVK